MREDYVLHLPIKTSAKSRWAQTSRKPPVASVCINSKHFSSVWRRGCRVCLQRFFWTPSLGVAPINMQTSSRTKKSHEQHRHACGSALRNPTWLDRPVGGTCCDYKQRWGSESREGGQVLPSRPEIYGSEVYSLKIYFPFSASDCLSCCERLEQCLSFIAFHVTRHHRRSSKVGKIKGVCAKTKP